MREQTQGSVKVLESITSLNGVTENVKVDARKMTAGVEALVRNMNNLNRLSMLVSADMKRIDEDVRLIRAEFKSVTSLIKNNTIAVDRVNGQIAKFKV